MSDEESKPSNIVPFGKYKGRSIEEILIDDPGYMQWLSGQDWFRAKFTFLHQTIINRGAEPEETPEHNALQVKFLDDDFCMSFLDCVIPNYAEQAFEKFNDARVLNLEILLPKIKAEKDYSADQELASELNRIENQIWNEHNLHWKPDRILDAHKQHRESVIKHAKRLIALEHMHDRLRQTIIIKFGIAREFEEHGVDVTMTITASKSFRFENLERNPSGSTSDSFWNERWHHWDWCDLWNG